jgi:hypothetical protein
VAAVAAASVVIGWIALVRGRPVPVLSLANLGFHELGHLLTYPFPDLFTAVMGSVTQVTVPVGLAGYFWWVRHDMIGVGACLAWAGASAQEVSVYIADAPYQRLPLLGGHHDWAFILGRFDAINAAGELAAVLLVAAWGLVLGALAACLWALPRSRPRPRVGVPVVRSRPISWD